MFFLFYRQLCYRNIIFFSRILDEEVLEVLDELNIPRVQTTDQLLARYVWKNEYFYCIDSTPRCFEHDYQAPNP